MRKILFLAILAITIASCKQVKKESNEAAPELSEVNKESEWISLFDGTSVDKWRGYLTDSIYPEWSIEDGAMVFTPSENGGKNIITKDTFTNFELSLEWKI